MAEPLLNRVQDEIRQRLRDLEPAVREYERVEAALAALRGVGASARDGREPAADTRAPTPSTRRSSGRRRARTERAPRGANRAAVLRVLGERPGVSVNELSADAGVGKPVLYNLLKTLEQRGEVAKERL